MRLVMVALAGVLAPSVAGAQTADTEPEIVVTAPLEGSRIESLQGAAVLRRDDIVATLSNGLGDTLNSLPGVASTFYGAGASRPVIRGLGDDRVRVLQNGVGAIDASSASPDHAATADGLDAERIEVLRGAAALAFGGNAIGGVVNVIDQSIPTRLPGAVQGEALVSTASGDDSRQGAARASFAAGDAFAFQLSAAARETENYAIPGFARSAAARAAAPLPPADEAHGEAPNSWTSLRSTAAGASFIQDWGFAGLAVKRTETEYGLPTESLAEAGGRIALEQTRIEARGDVRLSLGPFERLDFAVQRGDYQHAEIEGSGEIGTVFTNEGVEGRLEAHHHDQRHTGAAGVQIIDTEFAAEGEEAFITATATRDLGAFLLERYDLGGWGLEGGARYETRAIDNDGGGKRDFDTLSGSAGAFMRPAPNWFLGATLARTQRAPTAIELFADGPHLATKTFEIGNAGLSEETATSFELSVRYETAAASFEFSLYRIAFADYIALVERGDVWWLDETTDASGFAPDETDPGIPADAEILPVFNFIQQDAVFAGGEIIARAQLFDAGGVRLSADGSLELVRAEFDGGGHPPRIPPRSYTLGLEAEYQAATARVEWVNTSDQRQVSGLETPTEGYQLVNARVSFDLDGRATLLLDARNLTDEEGRVHASFLKDALPLPGRGVRVALTTRF